jgi:broad specificity phosphatase PhoE
MVVTHGLVKMATRAYLEGWDREKYLEEHRHNRPHNCGVTIYKSVEPQQHRLYRDNIALDKYNLKLY